MQRDQEPGICLEELGLAPGLCASFIGGGGKTSMIDAMAARAAELGWSVIVTTTTKMWPPRELPLVIWTESEPPGRLHAVLKKGPLALGREVGNDGKVRGISAEAVCLVRQELVTHLILCEADGSRGKPVKVHDDHEPVVPTCSDVVFVMLGLSAIGRPAGDVVHRLPIFRQRFAGDDQTPISIEIAAKILWQAVGRVPPGVRSVIALSQADVPERRDRANAIAAELVEQIPGAEILLVQRGHALRWLSPTRAAT